MGESLGYNEIQENQTSKQSPTNEDILDISKKAIIAQKISKESKQVEEYDKQKAENNIDDYIDNTSSYLNDSNNINIYNGGIDNSQKLSRINQEISDIENKIWLIEEKNELSTDDKRTRYKLKKQIRILDKERDTIKGKQ